MKKILAFVLVGLLILGISGCGSNSNRDNINRDIIENSKKALDEIDKVKEKSEYVSGLIDQYNNGK